jgi:hypothetical protein
VPIGAKRESAPPDSKLTFSGASVRTQLRRYVQNIDRLKKTTEINVWNYLQENYPRTSTVHASEAGQKEKAPSRDRAFAIHQNCLLPEAVYQSSLQAQIVLLCAAEMGVQILQLNCAKRQITRHLDIRSATERHGERIHRCRSQTSDSG